MYNTMIPLATANNPMALIKRATVRLMQEKMAVPVYKDTLKMVDSKLVASRRKV